MNKLIYQIHNELDMAEQYIDCAARAEDDAKDVYKSIARDELNHAEKLIAIGNTKLASKMGDVKCKVIWEYEKDNFASKMTKLRAEWSAISN